MGNPRTAFEQALQKEASADYEEQLRLLEQHGPRIRPVGDLYTVEIYSPFVKKYIVQGEWNDPREATEALAYWMHSHQGSIRLLKETIRTLKCAAISLSREEKDLLKDLIDLQGKAHAVLTEANGIRLKALRMGGDIKSVVGKRLESGFIEGFEELIEDARFPGSLQNLIDYLSEGPREPDPMGKWDELIQGLRK
jgi:hypothetical protein